MSHFTLNPFYHSKLFYPFPTGTLIVPAPVEKMASVSTSLAQTNLIEPIFHEKLY